VFLGTIPQPVRSILVERARAWGSREVWVACSGNFTVERALAPLGVGLHSNDVSLYTSVLGALFAGDTLRVRVRPEHREEWGWLSKWLRTPAAAAATVMLSTRMLTALHNDNAYYRRLRRSHVEQWPAIHAATVEKLKALELRLDSFTPADAVDWVRQAGCRSTRGWCRCRRCSGATGSRRRR